MSSPENPMHHSIQEVEQPFKQEKPLVNRFMKILPWTHFVLGPAEVAIAFDQSAATAALDGGENFLDGQLYNEETRNIDAGDKKQEIKSSNALGRLYNKITGDTRAKKRKFTYRMQFSSALTAGGWALYSLAEHNEEDPSAMHLAVTAGSLAIAGVTRYVGHKMKKRLEDRQEDDPELRKDVDSYYAHAGFDMWSSGLAVAGAALYPFGLGALEKVAGIGLAAYKAVRFRPTAKNLSATPENHSHSHTDKHDHHHEHEHHEHDDCGHFHLSEEASKVWKTAKSIGGLALNKTVEASKNIKKRWRESKEQQQLRKSVWWKWVEDTSNQPNNPLADWARRELKEKPELPPRKKGRTRKLVAGLASVAMAGGLLSGSVASSVEQETPAESTTAINDDLVLNHDDLVPDIPSDPPEAEQSGTFECEVAELGDSQWSIAADQARKVLGQEATEQDIYSIALLAAHHNSDAVPNPSQIEEDQCVDTLAESAINELVTNQEIANHLSDLLDLGFEQALEKDEVLAQINTTLQQAVGKS